jgi:RHS repeat-associated protein
VATDSAGAVKSRHDYMAFGQEIQVGIGGRSTTQKYVDDSIRQQYTGYERDNESGLDYAQARYYSSQHGRFTSVDPLMASASIKNPQTFNRYSYALNSPYKFTDPLGLAATNPQCGNGGRCDTQADDLDDKNGSSKKITPDPEVVAKLVNPTAQGVAVFDTELTVKVKVSITLTKGMINTLKKDGIEMYQKGVTIGAAIVAAKKVEADRPSQIATKEGNTGTLAGGGNPTAPTLTGTGSETNEKTTTYNDPFPTKEEKAMETEYGERETSFVNANKDTIVTFTTSDGRTGKGFVGEAFLRYIYADRVGSAKDKGKQDGLGTR